MQENFTNSNEHKKTIIIDVEHHTHNNTPHPEHEEGEIILYRIKVDSEYFNVEHRHRSGSQILSLVGKSPEHFKLEQSWKAEGGQIVLMHILPDVTVDFKTPGIEHFITSPIHEEKVYVFYVGPKEYKTTSSHLTVRQILVDFAKVDPQQKTLSRKIDNTVVEYKDLDQALPLEGCPRFTLLA